jgi:transcription elongation factor Elf1
VVLKGSGVLAVCMRCPKCNSEDVVFSQNICETTTNGYGLRIRCKQCGFTPPKSKWQWISAEKAIGVWNKYKRKSIRT